MGRQNERNRRPSRDSLGGQEPEREPEGESGKGGGGLESNGEERGNRSWRRIVAALKADGGQLMEEEGGAESDDLGPDPAVLPASLGKQAVLSGFFRRGPGIKQGVKPERPWTLTFLMALSHRDTHLKVEDGN
ncbi:hypothetical protein EYF80_003941 [Liparis tanakae]|uniref:Uncharacterized protein n=1 Tax=Liparis tanakae TaxID=230148 RepID=A0A4Z2J719_9TELE|nr:hypothetical protein EYF80_003941 [Liparis tanakae]